MQLDLSGRNVLVTGASKGIGRACAEAFASEGCSLDLVARDESTLDALAANLAGRFGTIARSHAIDLSAPDGQRRLAESRLVDIVVINAGAIPGGNLDAVDDEKLRLVGS
jgi:short-subunit dehydrogenase